MKKPYVKKLTLPDLPVEVLEVIVASLRPASGSQLDLSCLRRASRRMRTAIDGAVRRMTADSLCAQELHDLLHHFTALQDVEVRPSCDFTAVGLPALQRLRQLRSLTLSSETNHVSFEGLSALSQLTAFASDYNGSTRRAQLYQQLAKLTGLRKLDAPLAIQDSGVSALTVLTALSHLTLEGDGFGMAELALKLPALARLDLRLTLIAEIPDPELRATMETLATLTTLCSFALEAGPTQGLLRHLRLPPGLTATTFIQLSNAATTESGEDVAELLACMPGLKVVGMGGLWAEHESSWARIIPSLSSTKELHFSGPMRGAAGAQLQPIAAQLTRLSLQGIYAASATAEAATIVFAGLRRCRHISLRGCTQLDGSVLKALKATAATLQHLDCEDIGELRDDHLAPLSTLTALTSFRLTDAAMGNIGSLKNLLDLKFDLDAGKALDDNSLRQLSSLRLTSLSLPALAEGTADGLAALAGCHHSLRELSFRGAAQGQRLMMAAVYFSNLTSLRLRQRPWSTAGGSLDWDAQQPIHVNWQLQLHPSRQESGSSDSAGEGQGKPCVSMKRLVLAFVERRGLETAEDEALSGIKHLECLQELVVAHCGPGLYGSFLAQVTTNLMRLRFDSLPDFQAVSLKHLTRLPRLMELSLTHMPIDDVAAGILSMSLPPHLAVLRLTIPREWPDGVAPQRHLTGGGVDALCSRIHGDFGSLRELDLSCQDVGETNSAMHAIGNSRFTGLRTLVLDGASVEGVSLPDLLPLAGTVETISLCACSDVRQRDIEVTDDAFRKRCGDASPEFIF